MRINQFKNRLYSILLLATCGVLGFLGTVHSPFQYDDAHAIVGNPYIKDLSQFQELVGIGNIFNRSVLLLSFAINHEIGGLDVFGYHLVNISIHICVGILLFLVTRELMALQPAPSAHLPLLVALTFMLQPLAVQPVAYLSNRSALLVALFYLLSFYSFVRFTKQRTGTPPSFFLLFLSLLFFVLGSGTKETIVTLPIMAGVFLWLKSSPDSRKDWSKWTWVLLPVLIYLAYRAAITGGNPFKAQADPSFELMPRHYYFLTELKVIVYYYLLKWLLPMGLNFEPHIQVSTTWTDWQSLSALVILVMAGFFLRKQLLAKFALLWAIVAVLPESSFIPLKQLASEHRAYLPGMGISLLVGMGISRLPSQWARAGMFSFILLMAFLTLNRGLVYRTEIFLWEDTVRKSPQKIMAHNNLVSAYIDKKRFDDAEREAKLILQSDPDYSNAHSHLGVVYASRKQWEEARMEFDKSLTYQKDNHANHYNAGQMRINLNRPEEALPYLERAVALKPDSANYHFTLGNAYRMLKHYDPALEEYRLSLKYRPDSPETHNNMAVIFWELKMYDLAEAEFIKTVAIDKDNVDALNNLAGVYMVLKDYPKAIPYLEKVLTLQPNNENARDLLKVANILKDTNKP